MNYSEPQELSKIASLINAEVVGDATMKVKGQNEIHVVEEGDIVFVDHPKYYDTALKSAATVVLINKKVDCPEGKALLVVDDPFSAFNKLTKHFNPFIASSSTIDENAVIGEDTVIQPNVFIGPKVKIGKNCIIHPGVSIVGHATIGDNVIIHANVVIGSEAFYYKKRESGFDKLLTGGSVVIEDDVEIGGGSTVDRGVTGPTTIGLDTKIDNLCHIGHDTIIGKHCLIAAHTGVGGCSVIEDDVTIWGRVGVKSGVTIGAKAEILACSCVSKSLEGGKTYFGLVAQEKSDAWREMVAVRRLARQK
ncbi:UDP-3-O-(3-hydroxymyristoyl)glucosamine N-acyltransferase [Salibacter halophilus]|uniref:UDP-3-O-(3-hydroxymyristoyl)glucosamine N-acyltransferase n=1 Tax=Salibacter halophilus TaxID=1803916 RepID=A0A6N6M706_9FLAO|nr:LpxD N-terminal domain-containing protein [Salibacter halophilus]KAB1062089.1 UDP-3-O-(3-hydroxymyristoyl)glucosamine N-acyltransferase [Salibacter halophilus]